MQPAGIQVSVFLFCFAFGYLLSGKGPILALSTRALLVVLVGLAGTFALTGDGVLHSALSAATMVVNVLFLAFVAIDFLRWQRAR